MVLVILNDKISICVHRTSFVSISVLFKNFLRWFFRRIKQKIWVYGYVLSQLPLWRITMDERKVKVSSGSWPFLILSFAMILVEPSEWEEMYHTNFWKLCMDLEFKNNPFWLWWLHSQRVRGSLFPRSESWGEGCVSRKVRRCFGCWLHSKEQLLTTQTQKQ